MISLGTLIGVLYRCIDGYDLLQQRGTKQKQQREKTYKVKSRGNQAQASQSPLPVVSHRTCLIPFNELCQHMQSDVYHGSSFQNLCSGVLLGAAHVGTLYLACTKILDSQKESLMSV